MITKKTLCALLLVIIRSFLVECRSYNTGLIFYNLENRNTYLPPTISVSRGRGLANYKYSSHGSIWSTFGKPCECNGPLCGCCVGINVKQYNFDQKMCVNVSYAHPKDEIQLEVLLNDTTSAKYGISARNPSPLCVPIMMGIPMSMCVQMSNIGVQGDNLNMCMDFLVRLASTELFEMHFQCMKVGLQGASWVGANGQPVIPANEGTFKDKTASDSDEYYDENEAENEIISNGKDTEDVSTDMKEEDLDKSEQKIDTNDIKEKIMDIVKEQEQETLKDSSETSQENEVEGVFAGSLQQNKNMEQIVTDIMESINQANSKVETDKLEDVANEMEVDKNDNESSQEMKEHLVLLGSEAGEKQAVAVHNAGDTKTESEEESKLEKNKESNEMQTDTLDFVEPQLNDLSKENESSELEKDALEDKLNLDELFQKSEKQKVQMQSNEHKTPDTIETPDESQEAENVMTPITVLEETTTKQMINEQETTVLNNPEMILNSNEAEHVNTNEQEKSQSTLKTSAEIMMPPTLTVTSQANEIKNFDNSLTSAAIMRTTTKATTISKPTKSNANFVVPATFVKATDVMAADENNSNNDRSDYEEEETEKNDDDGYNSHENDSDYGDDESEEAEHNPEEKDIESANATTNTKPNTATANNKNSNVPKESLILQDDDTNSNSDESQSTEDANENENTNDEFETEEEGGGGEEEEEQEEVYDDDEYEDYETTTAEVTALTKNILTSDNNTCCKPNKTTLRIKQPFNDYNNNKPPIPRIETTAASNNLQFVSKKTISQTDDRNMLNTKSSNKMSQLIIDSTATATHVATASSTNAAISNVMPLPLARAQKLQSLYQKQQQHQQPQQKLIHQNRQRQHYA